MELQVVYFSIERWGTIGVVYTAGLRSKKVKEKEHKNPFDGVNVKRNQSSEGKDGVFHHGRESS